MTLDEKEQSDNVIGIDLAAGRDKTRRSLNITPEILRMMNYDLESSKQLLNQLQEASKAIMTHAWEKGFHVELAAHITGLKLPPKEGGADVGH